MIETLSQSVSRLSSPALRGFEINPFRVLRLAVNATTTEASFQAERVLTLVGAGLPPEESDPLHWLPPATVYELQQAAQNVEEPLLRLTDQLLWFDFVHDTASETLQLALSNLNGESLRKYIAEEIPLREHVEETTNETGVSTIAHAINQANLRLLMSASMINGVITPQTNAPLEPEKIARNKWEKFQGLMVLPEAHSVISGAIAESSYAHDLRNNWEGTLRRWMRILGHPWFKLYMCKCIADLNDDFTSTDDVEAIEESIRTRLADLAAKETRFLLLEGRYPLAGALVSAVSRSGFDQRVMGPALRPIHHLFQSEIAELQSLLDESEEDGVNHIDSYLKRLDVTKQRWMAIDGSGLIGLSHILDEAIEQAYLRLRGSQPSPELDNLLVQVSKLTTAKSLRERINSFQKELDEAKNRICHFCKTGKPDYDKSVVLEGQTETGREQNYGSTTIYYGIRYGIVLRCERCAQLHDFIGKAGTLALLATAPGLIVLFFPIIVGIVICLFVIAWYGGAAVIPWAGRSWLAMYRFAVALAISPSGHTRYGRYKDTETYDSLTSENYSVKAHWKSNAVSSLENQH